MKITSLLSSLIILSFTLGTSMLVVASDKATAKHRYDTKIIGGNTASKNEYPFITAITSSSSSAINPFCGASYIGGRYVLTAAHCVENSTPEEIDVWIGGLDISVPSEGTRVAVKEIYMHEDYSSFEFNKDIAILELEQVVLGISPINMMTPEIAATINEGELLTIMGWGTTIDNAEFGSYPNILNETQVPLYNRAACEAAYSRNGQTDITEFMLCAGYVQGGQDTCQGDSGGPIIYEYNGIWYQAGVVSFGDGCAIANAPGIYTSVPALNNWIAQKQEGVSYRQSQKIGFVEAQYSDTQIITISNLGEAAFSVNNARIQSTLNLNSAVITNNQCTLNVLQQNDSCDIYVQTAVSGLGSASFTLLASTNSALATPIEINASLNAIAPTNLDMTALTGSNNQYISWYSGGDNTWQVENTRVSEGASAAASGDISDLQSSVLLAKISDPRVTSIRFKYFVSSEEDYDFFNVRLNGEVIIAVSGDSGAAFKQGSINLPEGVNRISFSFEKDESISEGDDGAFLDDISLTIVENPTIPEASASSGGGSFGMWTLFLLAASIVTRYKKIAKPLPIVSRHGY